MQNYEKILKDYKDNHNKTEYKVAREVIAKMNDIPLHLLEILVKDTNKDVRYAALENPNISNVTVEKYLKSKHFRYKNHIAKNPNIQRKHYIKLLNIKNIIPHGSWSSFGEAEEIYINLIENVNVGKEIKNCILLHSQMYEFLYED